MTTSKLAEPLATDTALANEKSGDNKKSTSVKRPMPSSYRWIAKGLNGLGALSPKLAGKILTRMWFTPFHGKPSSRTLAFWQTAHRRKTVWTGKEWLDLYFWGEGPTVLGVHGWRGSGSQFRHLVEPLVAAGYQVCLFDLPAHGMNKTRFTHVFDFVSTLLAIEKKFGPIAGVVAHSFGTQAVVQALGRGFNPGHLAFFSPGMDAEAMLENFSDFMQLTDSVKGSFKQQVTKKAGPITERFLGEKVGIWQRLSHGFAKTQLPEKAGIMIADDQDEELHWSTFEQTADYWVAADKVFTSGLGHYQILKDPQVIKALVAYFQRVRTQVVGAPEAIH